MERVNVKYEPSRMEEDVVEEPEEHHEEEEEEEVEDPEEWEELTMVVTVNGILDADLVRQAIRKENVKLRYAETEAPVLQINNSLYTGTWTQDLGTNIVLQTKGKEMDVIACTSTTLTAEKALLTSLNKDGQKSDTAPRAALSRTQREREK